MMKKLIQWYLTLSLAMFCQASDQPKVRRSGEAEKKFHPMIGEWAVSGRVAKSPWGPARSVSGKETGRLRLNGLCLEIEGSLFYGNERHDSLMILAYSPQSKTYTASYLSSIAPLDIYELEIQSSKDGANWKSSWSEINQNEKYYFRDIRTFFRSQNKWSYRVEYSKDNETWMVLYKLTGKRLEQTHGQ